MIALSWCEGYSYVSLGLPKVHCFYFEILHCSLIVLFGKSFITVETFPPEVLDVIQVFILVPLRFYFNTCNLLSDKGDSPHPCSTFIFSVVPKMRFFMHSLITGSNCVLSSDFSGSQQQDLKNK